MNQTSDFTFDHPLGTVAAWFTPKGLCQLTLGASTQATKRAPAGNAARLHAALTRYFEGRREDFADIPLDLSGATAFRRQVWEAARTVCWGETVGYGQLAERMGRTAGCARAVGQALGANPVPIIVPCHRILAAGGKLGGFGAGRQWKYVLLRLERVWVP